MKNHLTPDLLKDIESQLIADGIQKKVAGGVIFIGDKILVCQRTKDEFMPGLVELPSGNVEENETLLEGLTREIKEETGLEVDTIDTYLGHFDYTSGSGKKTRQLNFLVTCKPGTIVLNPSEHEKYYLIGMNDLGNFDVSKEMNEILTLAFETRG